MKLNTQAKLDEMLDEIRRSGATPGARLENAAQSIVRAAYSPTNESADPEAIRAIANLIAYVEIGE